MLFLVFPCPIAMQCGGKVDMRLHILVLSDVFCVLYSCSLVMDDLYFDETEFLNVFFNWLLLGS